MGTTTNKVLMAGLIVWAVTGQIDQAHAQSWMGGKMDTGLYLGGGAGLSDSSGYSGDVDESDTGWKLFAGYQFNRYVAVEAGYYDLGKVTAQGVGASGSFRSKAYALSVVGSYPVWESFSLLARLGIARGEQKATVTVGTLTASASEDNTDVTYGLGVRYDFTRNLGVRAQWERFKVGGEDVGGKNDINLYSVDLIYRFGP